MFESFEIRGVNPLVWKREKQTRWVFVTGEPGVGKTQLLRELADVFINATSPSMSGVFKSTTATLRLPNCNGVQKVLGYTVQAKYATRSCIFSRKTEIHSLKESAGILDTDAALDRLLERDATGFAWMEKIIVSVIPGVSAVGWTMWGENRLTVDGNFVTLDTLSTSHRSLLGWLVDMVSHWPACTPTSEMEGVVILDNFDAHLHPSWQADVVRRLRVTFPNLCFVVACNSPCTLAAAEPGEVHVLRKDGLVQRDIPSGANASAVLCGAWFELSSTLPLATQEKLREYNAALRSGEDVTALEADLKQRMPFFADTSLEKLAWRVAAEIEAEELAALDSEGREELRKKVKERLLTLRR